MSNKEDTRTYHRKYLGILTELNGFRYFIPLSSPKQKDYNKQGKIKNDSEITIYIRNKERIENTAKALYEKKITQKEKQNENHNLFLTLNFKHLEQLCTEYNPEK